MVRRGAAFLLGASVLLGIGTAGASPEQKQFQFEYKIQPGAEICPPLDYTQMIVESEFTYDALTSDPYEMRRVVFTMSRRGGEVAAETEIFEGDTRTWRHNPTLTRPASPCECRELIRAAALTVAIHLGDYGPWKREENAAPQPAPCPALTPKTADEPKETWINTEPARTREFGRALPEAWMERTTYTASASYAEFDPARPWSVGVNLGGVLWEAGTIAPTAGITAGYRYYAFSGNAEARVVMPVEAGGFKPGIATLSLLPCLHWRFLYGCANGTAGYGWARFRGGTLDGKPTGHTYYLAIGGRLGLDLPLTSQISVLAMVDITTSTPLVGTLNYQPRRFPAVVFGQAGLGVAAHF